LGIWLILRRFSDELFIGSQRNFEFVIVKDVEGWSNALFAVTTPELDCGEGGEGAHQNMSV
jgi:hypothetical protein